MKKIRIERAEFMRVLSEGRAFAGKNKTMPILDCIRIAVRDGRIRVSSTDLNDYIQSYGVCLESEDVDFCVNAKSLVSYISAVSDKEVTLSVDSEKNILRIKHTNGKTKFSVCGSSEFPAFEATGKTFSVDMPASMICRWLSVAVMFAAKTKGGSVLEGVHICSEDGKLLVYGSDRNRIFVGEAVHEGIADFRMTLAPTAIGTITKAIKDCDTVRLEWDDNRLCVRIDGCVIATRLLDLKYPRLKQFVNLLPSESLSFESAAAIAACKRIQTQVLPEFFVLNMSLDGNKLVLRYEMTEFGKELSEEIEVVGNTFGEMKVNINRLTEAIVACGADVIDMRHAEGNASPLFLVNTSGEYKEYFGLSPMV